MGQTYLSLRMAIRHAIAHHLNRGGLVTDPEGLLESLGEELLAWLRGQHQLGYISTLSAVVAAERERMFRVEGHRNG